MRTGFVLAGVFITLALCLSALGDARPVAFPRDCKVFLTRLSERIPADATPNQIVASADDICGSMKEESRAQCKRIVSEHSIALAKRTDPVQICMENARMVPVLKRSLAERGDIFDLSCSFCEMLVMEAELFIASGKPLRTRLNELVKSTCEKLPAELVPICMSTAQVWVDQLLEFGEPKNLCKMLPFCYEENVASPEAKYNLMRRSYLGSLARRKTRHLPRKDVAEYIDKVVETHFAHMQKRAVAMAQQNQLEKKAKCIACEYVMSLLVDLARGKGREELEKLLTQACTKVPELFQPTCQSVVDTYTEVLIEAILAKLSPGEICVKVKLCEKETLALLPLSLHSNALMKIRRDEHESNAFCPTCEYLMTSLIELAQGKSEAELERLLGGVCMNIPPVFRDFCQATVDTYKQVIIDALLAKVSPREICIKVKLCKNEVLMLTSLDLNSEMVLKTEIAQLEKKAKCIACEYVMSLLVDLARGKGREELEKLLTQACTKVPELFQPTCQSVVDTYTEVLIEAILAKLSPGEICIKIKLCEKETLTIMPSTYHGGALMQVNRGHLQKSAGCIACEYVMTLLVDLAQGKGRDELHKLLSQVCSKVPAVLQGYCQAIVDEYTDVLVDAILAKLSPEEMCLKVKLCDPETLSNIALGQITSGVVKKDSEVDGAVTCLMCEYVAKMIFEMARNQDMTDLREMLNTVCSHVPAFLEKECANIVNEYVDVIIEFIENEKSPRALCTRMSMCRPEMILRPRITPRITTNKRARLALSANPEKATREWLNNYLMTNPLGEQNDRCQVCQWIVSAVESWLEDPVVQSNVSLLFQQLCTFPVLSRYEEICMNFVSIYTGQMLEYLITHQTPPVLCRAAHLCD